MMNVSENFQELNSEELVETDGGCCLLLFKVVASCISKIGKKPISGGSGSGSGGGWSSGGSSGGGWSSGGSSGGGWSSGGRW